MERRAGDPTPVGEGEPAGKRTTGRGQSVIGLHVRSRPPTPWSGHPGQGPPVFPGAIKKDRPFSPAYIGIGEILVREGKTKNAVEILKKIYAKTRSVIILHRLEELFLELGEPDEIIRVYQEAPAGSHNAVDPVLPGQAVLPARNGG